jgi:DNA-binding NarL/FixJ family response regulator
VARHTPAPIRLLIVDDHAPTRVGLRMRLAREADLQVIAETGDVQSGLALARQLQPDLVLVDLLLPDGNGIDFIHQLRQHAPRSASLILSMDDSRHTRSQAAAAGVAVFIGKQEPVHVLLEAIRRLARGPTSYHQASLS